MSVSIDAPICRDLRPIKLIEHPSESIREDVSPAYGTGGCLVESS